MILLVAVVLGLIAGLSRIWITNRRQQVLRRSSDAAAVKRRQFAMPTLRGSWLVLIAFLPQLVAFYIPSTSRFVSDDLAALLLTTSQLILLWFAWQNRHYPAFYLLIIGLSANFLVIISNGGLMPMSPATLERLVSTERAATWQVGERIAQTKDRLLRAEDTHFAFLSDRLIVPRWTGKRIAYSLGDVVIAVGAFWFLWNASEET